VPLLLEPPVRRKTGRMFDRIFSQDGASKRAVFLLTGLLDISGTFLSGYRLNYMEGNICGKPVHGGARANDTEPGIWFPHLEAERAMLRFYFKCGKRIDENRSPWYHTAVS
jgi:hypothetical protein